MNYLIENIPILRRVLFARQHKARKSPPGAKWPGNTVGSEQMQDLTTNTNIQKSVTLENGSRISA
jgi:hypothetical protein